MESQLRSLLHHISDSHLLLILSFWSGASRPILRAVENILFNLAVLPRDVLAYCLTHPYSPLWLWSVSSIPKSRLHPRSSSDRLRYRFIINSRPHRYEQYTVHLCDLSSFTTRKTRELANWYDCLRLVNGGILSLRTHLFHPLSQSSQRSRIIEICSQKAGNSRFFCVLFDELYRPSSVFEDLNLFAVHIFTDDG